MSIPKIVSASSIFFSHSKWLKFSQYSHPIHISPAAPSSLCFSSSFLYTHSQWTQNHPRFHSNPHALHSDTRISCPLLSTRSTQPFRHIGVSFAPWVSSFQKKCYMSKLIHSNIQKTKTREKEIHAKKKKTETNAPHALFAHRSWTTIRREHDAGVSRFFGDDASAFPFALMKEEERYKKNTPPPRKREKRRSYF